MSKKGVTVTELITKTGIVLTRRVILGCCALKHEKNGQRRDAIFIIHVGRILELLFIT